MCYDNTATPCDEAIKNAFRVAATHPLVEGKFGRYDVDRQDRNPEDPPSWRSWWAEIRSYRSHITRTPNNEDVEAFDEQVMHKWRRSCGTIGVPLPPKNEPALYVYRELANPVALHRRPASIDGDPRYKRMLDAPVGCFEITADDLEAFGDDAQEIARYVHFVKARHRVRLALSVAEPLFRFWLAKEAENKTRAANTTDHEEVQHQETTKEPPADSSVVVDDALLLPGPDITAASRVDQPLDVPGSLPV